MSYVDRLSDSEITDVSRSVLHFDQYDDWLPDPFYFDDVKSREANPSIVTGLVRRARPAPGDVESFRLPRGGPSTLRGVAIPFGLRIQANAAAVRIARKIRSALPRDRVLGFRFNPQGGHRFSSPRDGIEGLENILSLRLLVDQGRAIVTDVTASSERMQWPRLAAVLSQLGADAEDLGLIGLCYGRGPGLPSGDDAWSFLLNYYFRPVDAALLSRHIDFYRVRDEYITFNSAHAAVVAQLLQTFGFGSVSTRLRNEKILDDLTDACNDVVGSPDDSQPSREQNLHAEVDILSTSAFTVKGSARCDPQTGNILSDSQELYVAKAPNISPAAAVDRLRKLMDATPDAVDMAPLLRLIWSARQKWVAGRSTSVARLDRHYAAAIKAARASLAQRLARSTAADSAWTGHVCAILLSDMAPLDSAAVAPLLAYARSPSAVLGGSAAQAALARASGLGPDQILGRGFPRSGHSIARRWDGLTALYFAQRGATQPFDRWVAACRSQEPALAERLASFRSAAA